MAIELANLSKDDLMKLQKDVASALKDADVRARKDARAAAEKAAAEFGFTLEELVNGEPAKKKPAGVAKYRNPNNPAETWTGRGRKPRWLNEAIAAGVDISDLEI
ncbi:MAG: H-NS family nucleoid-associated regulatory protein [Paracoccaceae bacterium]